MESEALESHIRPTDEPSSAAATHKTETIPETYPALPESPLECCAQKSLEEICSPCEMDYDLGKTDAESNGEPNGKPEGEQEGYEKGYKIGREKGGDSTGRVCGPRVFPEGCSTYGLGKGKWYEQGFERGYIERFWKGYAEGVEKGSRDFWDGARAKGEEAKAKGDVAMKNFYRYKV
ncbi:hypothetical protein K491DRAFT_718513 [Lophiostoma macrostomum CBS 122681]|uniref:Uncharacterized protein n=1 Tax=Lophiostoma macrostomum CBS 122681 TaxID=1314788 RepID=A0A6A6T1A2_9PLEO|nr:hypothetical protein K491DRAFT_718513 [Lophiostoma macrostomum CBS 122681]